MLQKTVTEIPAHAVLRDFRKQKQKLRVAAYCRVSTEEEEQQNSFEVQVSYYTDKITHHDDWQLAGIFSDDGISGVSTKNKHKKAGAVQRHDGSVPEKENRPDFDKIHLPVRAQYTGLHQVCPYPQKLGYPRHL